MQFAQLVAESMAAFRASSTVRPRPIAQAWRRGALFRRCASGGYALGGGLLEPSGFLDFLIRLWDATFY
jgi:hypothetical protein